jgi:hypothetical protein
VQYGFCYQCLEEEATAVVARQPLFKTIEDILYRIIRKKVEMHKTQNRTEQSRHRDIEYGQSY